jgi:SSS family transporter
MILNGLDYSIIILYLVATVAFGLYVGRKMKDDDDYFLAGRSLPWWAIGMSLVVTDIGAVDMVGAAGAAYLYGIVMGNYDWLGSVPVMIVGAFLFIPMFYKVKVTTIPEWLGRRYNIQVRTTSALIWGVYMSFGLGITLYATALMFGFLLELSPRAVVITDNEEVAGQIALASGAKKTHNFFYNETVEEANEFIAIVAAKPLGDKTANIVLLDADFANADAINFPEGVPVVTFKASDVLDAEGSATGAKKDSWGAQVMNQARPPAWKLWYSVVLVGVLIGGYTMLGGLKAVVYTDMIQCIVMLGGALFTLFYGIYYVGGFAKFHQTITDMGERTLYHFELIVPMDSGIPHPWTGIFLGLGLVLANAYWLGNQTIVQRTLGARSLADAKASYVFGSILKVLIPFAMIVPGIVALAHAPDIADADLAMATLVRDIMPSGFKGLFFAAFLAGLMSSVDSALNSNATIWTKDIYQQFVNKNASPTNLLVVGRVLTAVFLVCAMWFALNVNKFESIYGLTQTLLSVFQGPSLAIILIGMLWKRATGMGALAGLIGGVSFSVILLQTQKYASEDNKLFVSDEPFLYVAWWSFVFAIVATVVVSLLTKPKTDEELQGLVYTRSAKKGN